MCGVLAVFGKRGAVDVEGCDAALLVMSRRGPDRTAASVFLDNRLYLGQTVLSITGDSSAPEPTSGRYEILFNGEIYNHARLYDEILRPRGFSRNGGTDTEVLTKLHSVLSPAEVYGRLSGMFAYVAYDRAEGALLVGRDTVGEKPLYRYEDERTLIFSSEIGPILRLVPDLRMDRDVLREYFFTRHLLTSERTVWKNTTLVPPGQLRKYDLHDLRHRPTLCVRSLSSLVDPRRIEDNKRASRETLTEELHAACREAAIDLCPGLDYASVVSGGVDSSLASWFMGENENKPELVALQFPGKDLPSADESLRDFEWEMQRPVYAIKVTEQRYRDRLDFCYQVACSPLPTHSYVSQAILAELVRDLGLRVLVLGEGADELFGGYEAYRSFRSLAETTEVPALNPSVYSGFSPCGLEFEGWQPEALRIRQAGQWRSALDHYRHEKSPFERTVQAALLLDATEQLQSVGIRSADQMSMAYSVEARSFYLHDALVRFALSLPARHKLDWAATDSRFVTKPLLKRLFARKFGAGLIREKNGFSGWPNEAGHVLVGSDYRMVREVLGPFKLSFISQRQWRAAEWKMANVSLFLRRFEDYA